MYLKKIPRDKGVSKETVSGVIFRKVGHVYSVRCDNVIADNNGIIGSGIPTLYRPSEITVIPCVIVYLSPSKYTNGYVTVAPDGIIQAVEFYNGSYTYPVGAAIFFSGTWIQD